MKKLVTILLAIGLVFSLAACSETPSTATETVAPATESATTTAASSETAVAQDDSSIVVEWEGVEQPPWFEQPTAEQLELATLDDISGQNMTPTYNGIQTVSADQIAVTDEQYTKLKEGGYKAAICMHSMSFDWPTEQVRGLKQEFENMGIEVVSVADANYNDATQMEQVRAAIAADVDIIVSLPVDPATTYVAFQEAAAAGITLVFMSQGPDNMEAGVDYASVVIPDDFGNGMVAADLMADAIGGTGKVGALYYATDYATTNLRYLGFVTRLKVKYPDIQLVYSAGFEHQDDTQEISTAMFTQFPDLNGVWVAWNVPAQGTIAAARLAGLEPGDCQVITEDLDYDAALNIAQQNYIYGLGTQFPYDMGMTEAKIAGLKLLGEDVPPVVSYANLAVDRSNVVDAYKAVWHEDAGEDIESAVVK